MHLYNKNVKQKELIIINITKSMHSEHIGVLRYGMHCIRMFLKLHCIDLFKFKLLWRRMATLSPAQYIWLEHTGYTLKLYCVKPLHSQWTQNYVFEGRTNSARNNPIDPGNQAFHWWKILCICRTNFDRDGKRGRLPVTRMEKSREKRTYPCHVSSKWR